MKFENTKDLRKTIIRVVGGLAVFLIANAILKTIFGFISVDELANVLRVIRYGILVFFTMGMYPMIFRFKKIF